MTLSAKAKSSAPKNTHTGIVNSQARARLRTVPICRPEPLAVMVPATAEESTWVVLTGKPARSAAARALASFQYHTCIRNQILAVCALMLGQLAAQDAP